MMYVLIVCVLVGAFLAVKNNSMPSILKAGVVGGAVVISALMYGIDAKFWGVVVMGGAVIIMFFLPWLDHSPVKSIRYRPDWHKYVYAVFVIDFLILGYLGVQPPSPIGERVSQVGTMFYFGFFLLMPWWSKLGTGVLDNENNSKIFAGYVCGFLSHFGCPSGWWQRHCMG